MGYTRDYTSRSDGVNCLISSIDSLVKVLQPERSTLKRPQAASRIESTLVGYRRK